MLRYCLDMETLTPTQRAQALRRFEEKFIPEPNSGCWLWIAADDGYGYGSLTIKRVRCRAHRVSLLLYRGIDAGALFVLHGCDVPCCVNPDHLRVGTAADNSADYLQRGRHRRELGRGVSRSRSGKYRAYRYVRVNGKKRQIHLGIFATEEKARAAVVAARSRTASPT